MKNEDFAWFKATFGDEVNERIRGTPFSLDLLAAIAAQETGSIWSSLRSKLSRKELLAVCVGDTLDADKGRRAFPKTADELRAAPRGEEMFRIAHDALVAMAAHVPGFAGVARRPNKFCHGYGIFQYDLQFFQTDPDYFLQRRWHDFTASLEKCVIELKAAMRRAGLGANTELTELEMVQVAIAYNAGSFKPAKGLKQGHFDGTKFYGERIFDLLRQSKTVASGSHAAAIAAPEPNRSAVPPPSPVRSDGALLIVDVESSPLRVRREPTIDDSNVIAHLPDGHSVRRVSGSERDRFWKIETSLNGAHIEGFAAAKYLKAAADAPAGGERAQPAAARIEAVHAPNKSGTPVRRTDLPTSSGARSLLEAGQPARSGATPEELRRSLHAIVAYLAVDKASHLRYQPTPKSTYCNLYAHDYCHLAGVYLPRVWWTPDSIERLARGETVEARVAATVDEQRANDLFRWLRAFGERFGWRQTGTASKLQADANAGAVCLIVAMTKEDGRPGHIAVVVPETADRSARRDAAGVVVGPLQSQAGRTNFRYGSGSSNWWQGTRFSDSAFWVHS